MIRTVLMGTNIPRDDGTLLDEQAGAVHTKTDAYSVARMQVPPAWKEPAQTARFDELVLVMQGTLAVQADGRAEQVGAHESCQVGRGTTVTFSDASASVPGSYWSICIPAFASRPSGLPAFRPGRSNVHA